MNHFDEDQRAEIQAGKAAGLDVSYYAKEQFLAIQMRQIRLGLMAGLDVTVYNKPEYDWFQMEEIRKGIAQGLNYSIYAKPSVDYKIMRQIRLGLKDGIDLSPFMSMRPGVLEELRKALVAKVSLVEYIKEGYEEEQLREIRFALEKKLKIKPYITQEFRGASIREIALGLESGVDVSIYASMDYGWQQMREIRLGMEERLDVAQYCNSLFSWQQMREIRFGLKEGIDVTPYKSYVHMPFDMERIRKKISSQMISVIIGKEHTTVNVNKNISVFLSKDEMEACVEIRCERDQPITVQDIENSLKAEGICKGILKKQIELIVRDKKYRQTIVVAQGQVSQKGEDGRYEFFFNTPPTKKPRVREDGSVDFKEVNWFELVKKGQKLAYYHEAREGQDGYTVTGISLKSKKGKEQNLLTGKGFELLEDGKTYVATMDGKVDLIAGHRMEVNRVCIFQNVNLTTGHVNFDGSVYVRGNVGSGAVICATDNVIVDGYVENAVIRCGGQICLNQGVNGGGTGYIEAKKAVMGQFFEAVKVVSGGDISAQYCLNCELYTEGQIIMYGRKGMIAGGYARAGRGIKVHNVGNKVNLNTVLNVGVDENVTKEMQLLEGRIQNVNKELTMLNHLYLDFQNKYSAEVRNTMELYLKVENAIYTKQVQMKELMEKQVELESSISEMAGARVVISGTVFDGAAIIVDNIRWKAFSVRDVTIRCVNKKIVVESN